MRTTTPIKVVLAALVLVCGLSANIGPPTVSYTVTGVSGDYTLDFTFNNNTNQDLYFFGVATSGTITGSAAGIGTYPSWNNSSYGGSNINYNDVWYDPSVTLFPAGTSLSGFDVTISDAVAPTSVNWFAYTNAGGGAAYSGGGNFYGGSGGGVSTGFEGVAGTGSATPEPSYLIVAAGIVGLIGFRKLRMRQQQNS
jgi:hypothetical protein